MSTPVAFWDRIADRYSRKPVPNEAVYQEKLSVTRRYLRPDMKLLEFGCGTGSTAIAHAPHVKHILATDISGEMIRIAREKAQAAGVANVTFEQTAVDELTLPDQSIDVALGLSILHLLEDKEAAIAKVHRLLKPSGVFITSTPCLGDKMKFFKFIGPIGRRLGLMPMVKVFTQQQLKDSISAAGFTIDYCWRPESSTAIFLVAKETA